MQNLRETQVPSGWSELVFVVWVTATPHELWWPEQHTCILAARRSQTRMLTDSAYGVPLPRDPAAHRSLQPLSDIPVHPSLGTPPHDLTGF